MLGLRDYHATKSSILDHRPFRATSRRDELDVIILCLTRSWALMRPFNLVRELEVLVALESHL